MKYLLDSNACVAYLRSRSSPVYRHLQAQAPKDIALCAVVKEELYYGAQRSVNPARSLAHLTQFFTPYISLPFDDAAAEVAGRIRAHLAARGTPIGANDLLIAAIAITHDLTLVTHNTREFSRVAEVRLVDWETQP